MIKKTISILSSFFVLVSQSGFDQNTEYSSQSLRVPLSGISERFKESYAALTDSPADRAINRLIKMISSITKDEIAEITKDFETSYYVSRSVDQCLRKGWLGQAGCIMVIAIKEGVSGYQITDVKNLIKDCFEAGDTDAAQKIIREAIKQGILISSSDLIEWIEQCFKLSSYTTAGGVLMDLIITNPSFVLGSRLQKWIDMCFLMQGSWGLAGQIAIEAVKIGAEGVSSQNVRAWIDKCLKLCPDKAGQLAIEAIKKRITGVSADDVIRAMEQCFDDGSPDLAGNIALEAIKADISGISSDDVKRAIRICLNLERIIPAGSFLIEAVKQNLKDVGAFSDLRDFINRYFTEAKQASSVGRLALKTVKQNFEDTSSSDIKTWIEKCFERGQSLSAGQIVLEVVKQNVKDIAPADIKIWMEKCFEEGQPVLAGQIAIEAVKRDIPGVSVSDVKKAISLRFDQEVYISSLSLSFLPVETVTQNVSGILSSDINSWIEKCFGKDPYSAGQIALAVGIKSQRTAYAIKTLNTIAVAYNIPLSFAIPFLGYAIDHEKIENLKAIFKEIQNHPFLISLLEDLIATEGQKVIIQEIFEKGLTGFIALYDNVYNHLFDSILPDTLDIKDKRVNALLRRIVRFDTSAFSKDRHESFEAIYERFAKDHKAGKIAPLPQGLPAPEVLEVARNKRQDLRPDAVSHYQNLMESVKQSLDSIKLHGENPYLPNLNELIEAIDKEVAVLQARGVSDLGELAQQALNKKIELLNSAKRIFKDAATSDSSASCPLLGLTAETLKELSKLQGVALSIRTILFTYAFLDNEQWMGYFESIIDSSASLKSMKRIIEFADSFIKPHLLDKIDPKVRTALLSHVNMNPFKEEVKILGEESDFIRRIEVHLTRGWLAEFIGYISDECWTRTSDIMRDNPEMIAMVMIDKDTRELLGGTLLIPNKVRGKKVLIDRGLSPRTEVTADLNMESFMEQVTAYEEKVARVLKATAILVPLRSLEPGLGSNNPDVIQYYERVVKNNPPLTLGIPNIFNNHDITRGRCVVFEEVESVPTGQKQLLKKIRYIITHPRAAIQSL